jgi:hypothetical protein
MPMETVKFNMKTGGFSNGNVRVQPTINKEWSIYIRTKEGSIDLTFQEMCQLSEIIEKYLQMSGPRTRDMK